MSVPTDGIRLRCYELAQSAMVCYTDILVVICVVILYCFRTYNMSNTESLIIDVLLYITTLEMNGYAIIKLIGYGSAYFHSSWNRYSRDNDVQ